ncbi:MAG: hypothetical protein M1353_04845 [Nitrospirae bacterium]|nr:hypothetical protein [Nitrospirota bacterium]
MTLDELRDKVRKWDFQSTGSADYTAHYSTILDQLDYHAVRDWRVYLPAEHPDFHSNYMERLAAWIGNLTDEAEQKLFLEYALYISFFSHDDFVALYRTALDREIKRWVAIQVGARLESHGGQALHELVHREIHNHTWFCPVTDSMDINEFHKVNHLAGVAHRPCFASVQMEAEHPINPNSQIADDWTRYMTNPSSQPLHYASPSLKRLVLLEDIVGSGTQCLNAIRWAVANLDKPVLFVPLILCPNGVEALRAEERRWSGRLSVRPVIELRRNDLLGPERQGQQGWPIADKVEDLAQRCASRSSVNMDTFGYKNTGCSLATFSNTPDNTLPIIHNKPSGGGWEPLFPRVYRD